MVEVLFAVLVASCPNMGQSLDLSAAIKGATATIPSTKANIQLQARALPIAAGTLLLLEVSPFIFIRHPSRPEI